MQKILATLSPAEQATLKLCGITQDAQLARAQADIIAKDLQICREHFPAQTCEIPHSTLQRICAAAREQTRDEEEAAEVTSRASRRDAEMNDGLHFSRSCPPLIVSKRSKNRSHAPGTSPALPLSAGHEDIEKLAANITIEERSQDKQVRIGEAAAYEYHNAVHNTHSIAVYLGAWATILLVADVCAVIIIPLLIILGFDVKINIRTTGLYFAIAGALPYLLLNTHAVCSVCRIGIFSFKKYSHNRQAHWMPILGCALPTALHVAFCFWFRCPACGTPQKIFRRARHKH